MSRENVAIVQRGLEYYLATGEPPWELFDEEVEVFDHDTPDQGAYRGHAGWRRWLEDWGAAWAEWSIEPEELIEAGDSVVVFIRMKTRGRGSGVEIERADAQVYRLRDGKIVRLDYYNDRQEALKAVGLAE
jgi:ketosteroid isomerase-like protein